MFHLLVQPGTLMNLMEKALLFEGDGATTRVDGAVADFGVQELARPVEKLVLVLARRPYTSRSALQTR